MWNLFTVVIKLQKVTFRTFIVNFERILHIFFLSEFSFTDADILETARQGRRPSLFLLSFPPAHKNSVVYFQLYM